MKTTEALTAFLSKLEGRTLFEVLVGPAGVHYHFALGAALSAKRRELSVLSDTPIHITSNLKQIVFSCGPYPAYACQDELAATLLTRQVAEAAFDPEKNALRLVLDREILLSLLPRLDEGGQETVWSVHSHLQEDTAAGNLGFLIGPTSIKPIKQAKS
jgi:hypothetical protein